MNLAVLTTICPSFRAFDAFLRLVLLPAHRAAACHVPGGGHSLTHGLFRFAFASSLAFAFACLAASSVSAISLPSHCRIGAAADFRSQTIRFMRAQKHFSSRALVNHIDTGQVSHAGEGSGRSFSSSAAKTVDRVIDVFPTSQQNQVRATLAESLKGVVAQNLFRRIDKPGRVAAMEVLVFDTAIANLVREGKTHQIPGMIQVGKKKGNQPLDDAIMEHLRHLRISPEEAYEKANDKKKFRPFLTQPPDDFED